MMQSATERSLVDMLKTDVKLAQIGYLETSGMIVKLLKKLKIIHKRINVQKLL